MAKASFPLWSDEPTARDLLSFGAVAATVVDAVLDDKLDPIALGLSGSWGSGKTSVLELVKAELQARADGEQSKVLVVSTHPWRYDPSVGPKESLIAEVLDALAAEIPEDAAEKTKGLIKRLAARVRWAKAIKMAALTAITVQLPNVKDLLDLVSEEPGGDGGEGGERGLGQFREDFEALLGTKELKHISRVVVLVDDLDRCLPETVLETLEAIRLFLSAKGMSFVIAADEDRVADAIQQRIQAPIPTAASEVETPAKLYLHKIVQTTIPLPALSRFDTHAYLFLLLAEDAVDDGVHNALAAACSDLRVQGGTLDDLELPDGADLANQLAVSSRLTPILYEKFKGNPRRIKRFLNDLNVRQSVAMRRGITLPSEAVAKLMVLERLLRTDFDVVLGWLAQGKLRDRLEALDQIANQTSASQPVEAEGSATGEDTKKESVRRVADAEEPANKPEQPFTDTLIRWAKLPPRLDASDVSGYLYLAASFAGVELIDDGLPERLRDIASALTSSLRVDRNAITDESLLALSAADARKLITHLGSRTRDQPTLQKYSVAGILRLVSLHRGVDDAAVTALKQLPPSDVQGGTPMLLKQHDPATFAAVLAAWDQASASPQARRGITSVRQSWSSPDGN